MHGRVSSCLSIIDCVDICMLLNAIIFLPFSVIPLPFFCHSFSPSSTFCTLSALATVSEVESGNMVYPFPRSPITAQTPHHLLGIENSRDAPCRKDKPLVAYKRTAVIVVIITLVLLWMISPFSTSSNQNDRIPLSHDAIEEWVSTPVLKYLG